MQGNVIYLQGSPKSHPAVLQYARLNHLLMGSATLKEGKRRPRILIIYTGGTIGMIENLENGSLEPFNFDHLMDNVPKVKMLDYDIENFQFETPLDSSTMTPEDWVQIVKVIEKN